MMVCPRCGREFDGDPLYEAVGAVPHPENPARQTIAYHTLRLRFFGDARAGFESEGCLAVGLAHG